ncbi:MAG: DEAD/DEAH box helicase [Pseudohongiellaceae bacterium]
MNCPLDGEAYVRLVRNLIESIDSQIDQAEVAEDQILETKELLTSISPFKPDGSVAEEVEPLTPLLDTTLLTNARNEPRIGAQIEHEIQSANRIDILMAFIRVSGIRPFIESLKRHCQRYPGDSKLRILTTTYTGSTELKALKMLEEIGAEIKVSYDTSIARLHAKAWHFHRESGTSTAYIGSSNITYSAQESGIEWNVRVSGVRNPDVLRKMSSMFNAYWSGGEFRDFDAIEFSRNTSAETRNVSILLSPIELRLEPFQERLLEQINVARNKGRHRNLLVAATGTGKTVMAAVDYSQLRKKLPRSRLLFVAHREEILQQSMDTYRYALREASFGEMWVGRHRPNEFENVFASIQSLSISSLDNFDPDYFDVVVVDEFHHSAAPTYQRLLSHIKPKELLGLTATPERADGLSVLDLFEGRIAAELRLWDAIDQHRLVPFTYYGIHDGLDLRDIPWRRGQGYDVNELSNLYSSNDAWARLVIKELVDRIDHIESMKALGFCVSIQHARFMAHHFNKAGIAATAVWGETSGSERNEALKKLADGSIRILFSVDLFNEGVDVPSVDTLLLLRPTESATLFLQQLGRGLRKSKDKSVCAVLDFIGMHRKEFRFDRRLSALLGGTRRYLEEQVDSGFPYLPAGCHMELDPVASDIILGSLKNALPSRWREKVAELRSLMNNGLQPSLENYIFETGLDIRDIYTSKKSWSDYLEAAGVNIEAAGPQEEILRRSIGRLLHIDDEERLNFYIRILDIHTKPNLNEFSIRELRLVRMLIASVCERALGIQDTLQVGVNKLWAHPQVIAELKELFLLLFERVDHVHSDLISHQLSPLQIHGQYTRIEILAALGVGETARTRPWREGVLWVEDEKVDVLAFTLNKSDGNFSPTTMYRDYAISQELIHWESQSNTRASSPTGQRYCNHETLGSEILLFARESTNDRAFWFLGPATYVSHESQRPMGIKWKLRTRLPGDLYSRFSAAVA